MSEAVFGAARVSGLDANSPKQFAQTTAFGTAGVVIANKPGRLYRLAVSNSNATTSYYVQLFDKAIAPIATNVPIWEERIEAAVATTGKSCVIDFGLFGLYFGTGIGLALSSTKGVLTLAGATDGTAYALYAAQVALPIVTSVSPATGTAAGGTNVTITGSGFGGATSAALGGTNITSFVVVSDTSITGTSAAHGAALVDATVTGIGGTGIGRNLYTYT